MICVIVAVFDFSSFALRLLMEIYQHNLQQLAAKDPKVRGDWKIPLHTHD